MEKLLTDVFFLNFEKQCSVEYKLLLLPNKIFLCSAYFLFVVILQNSVTAAAVCLLFTSLYKKNSSTHSISILPSL